MSGSMLPRRYRVTENRRETADTRTLSLAPLDAPIPRFRSGQFTMVYLFGVGEIPLSISGCPRVAGHVLVHTVRAVGAVSAALRGLAAAGALPPDVRLVTDFGEPTGLIELWRDARLAIVVDAAAPDPASGLAAGDVVRWEAEYRDSDRSLTAPRPVAATTHALGPGTAIALASVLGRLPGRLVLFAVVGADFSPGPGLSPHVADTVRGVARDIVDEIRAPGLSARANGDLLSWPGRGAGPRLGS